MEWVLLSDSLKKKKKDPELKSSLLTTGVTEYVLDESLQLLSLWPGQFPGALPAPQTAPSSQVLRSPLRMSSPRYPRRRIELSSSQCHQGSQDVLWAVILAWVMPSLDYPTSQTILAVGYPEFHNKTLHYEKKALAFDTKIECTCKLLEHNILPKNFTIKWWHLSRLKSYNSIHSLLWSRKLKLHLLDIDLETSIFKVTTDQFFMAESYIRGKFPVVLLLKGFHSLCLRAQDSEPVVCVWTPALSPILAVQPSNSQSIKWGQIQCLFYYYFFNRQCFLNFRHTI